MRLKNVAKTMLIDASIHASTSIWETASTDSTAYSLTPSSDKLSSQNPPKTSAKNSIFKIFVLLGTNAGFLITCERRPVYSTQWGSASSDLKSAAFRTTKLWMSVFPVFLT